MCKALGQTVRHILHTKARDTASWVKRRFYTELATIANTQFVSSFTYKITPIIYC